MTLQEKIGRLVRYCGQYQSHGFMMDERNTDDNFNVAMPEEKAIRQSITGIKVILMTGEAGDGKSRILRNIDQLLKEHNFSEPCRDFSALTETERIELIFRLKSVLDGKIQDKIVISANVGVFTQAVIQADVRLMNELTAGRNDVYICNFENRNLAEDSNTFSNIVKQFLHYDENCMNQNCSCFQHCIYRINIEKLLSDSGLEAIRTICNAIYLTGGHVTFRELLSLLAYSVTFGQDCLERHANVRNQVNDETVLYYNIFEDSNDILLSKVSSMDPALRRGDCLENITSKKDYIRYRRQQFFEDLQNQYAMLNVDYLVEFYEVLTYMNNPPYNYDTVQDKNPILQKLKIGINKMSNRGKSDTGLILTDTPSIFDSRIRTEFLIMEDISMIWHRYDLRIGTKNQPENKQWNKFYLSYISNMNGEKKLISLLIDYRQFYYLHMCSQDYFMNRSELTLEEFSVNTFYRKILQAKEQAYDSIMVRFDEKTEDKCDFSLTVHSKEDLFTGEKKQMIRIRKED